MSGPAAGTARRLAGIEASGIPPNTGMSTGATPTWAASVTASGAGTPRPSNFGPRTAMPAHAPADRRNPIDPASMGSTRTRAVTASASTRRGETGRPRVVATSARPAMATARSTDGSHLVITPKTTSTHPPTTSRWRSESRRMSGAAMTKTKATF